MEKDCDFLVIGSGLAGLFFALKVADHGKVVIACKGESHQSNSQMAQGGVAAVVDGSDSFESHIQDTLNAGAGLCNPDVVRAAVQQAPARIHDLVNWGVKFDLRGLGGKSSEDADPWDLTKEGGHSERRILHVQDFTGKAIQDKLLERARAHPNIELLEHHLAIDLITTRGLKPTAVGQNQCYGASLFDYKNDRVINTLARWTVLATGGAGKVYLYTTNWSGSTGDGIAMAHRAGARVANLEFMQFHPTCLYHPQARNFLISEALRGEGGELINTQGAPFMREVHPMGSLAPRDIVARSIDAEMKRSGAPSVFIDITHKSRTFLQERFPVIYKKCMEFGIDMAAQPIPVVPAAHYLCGGVLSDINGRTDIANLMAVGETACNGFHGANRLASNSLLDCTVFSNEAARFCLENRHLDARPPVTPRPWQFHNNSNTDEMIVITHMWDEIRQLMWNYVGIVRSIKRLQRAQHRLQTLTSEIRDYYWNFRLHPDILELRNIALVANLTVRCALKRKESRGIHYNLDYPALSPKVRDTVL